MFQWRSEIMVWPTQSTRYTTSVLNVKKISKQETGPVALCKVWKYILYSSLAGNKKASLLYKLSVPKWFWVYIKHSRVNFCRVTRTFFSLFGIVSEKAKLSSRSFSLNLFFVIFLQLNNLPDLRFRTITTWHQTRCTCPCAGSLQSWWTRCTETCWWLTRPNTATSGIWSMHIDTSFVFCEDARWHHV